ncbi:MAG: Uma2 family endonuclease [Cyclobacteriaceae bacterium]
MVDGSPIHYQGYKKYLKGEKSIEDIMGSSVLQSAIITKILLMLHARFGDQFFYLSNEVGIQFSKKSWRAADLAVVEKKKIKDKKISGEYLQVPPRLVVEIDTKAALDDVKDTFGYYHKKTTQLLDFGVEKVVWIYTDLEIVVLAEKGKDWQIIPWHKDFYLLDDLSANIKDISAKL